MMSLYSSPVDLDAVRAEFLVEFLPCDVCVTTGCTCVSQDYRRVMQVLIEEIEFWRRIMADAERARGRLDLSTHDAIHAAHGHDAESGAS